MLPCKYFTLSVAAIAICTLSTNALAHPGHSIEVAPANSAVHYLVQPEHALTWVISIVVMWFVTSTLVRRLVSRPA